MEPRIVQGDVVVVRQQNDVASGETAVVMVGDEATCKKVIKHKDGIALVANNPRYEPLYFTRAEIEQLPVKVLGKVIELRAKF